MKRRAIIIGGSMSGLFSAAFLRQIGWVLQKDGAMLDRLAVPHFLAAYQ